MCVKLHKLYKSCVYYHLVCNIIIFNIYTSYYYSSTLFSLHCIVEKLTYFSSSLLYPCWCGQIIILSNYIFLNSTSAAVIYNCLSISQYHSNHRSTSKGAQSIFEKSKQTICRRCKYGFIFISMVYVSCGTLRYGTYMIYIRGGSKI